MNTYLSHVGVGHLDGGESGRYPWGSGEHSFQRDTSFLGTYQRLKSSGMSDTDIAKAMNMSTTEFRQKRSVARNQERIKNRAEVSRLYDEEGYSFEEIGKKLGISASGARELYKPKTDSTENKSAKVVDILKRELETKKYIDVGSGTELDPRLGVSSTRLKTALAELKDEGYTVSNIYIPQATNPRQKTTITVLAPPGTTVTDLYKNQQDIKPFTDYDENDISPDMPKIWQYPSSLDSNRVMIVYGDEGGTEKDGIIELRPGVEDISLGNSSYAQVRIAVDGTHFMKGMAMYSKDIPEGYDVIYYTHHPKGSPIFPTEEEQAANAYVFKRLKDDRDNPFGANLRELTGQREYNDPITGEKKLSPINKLQEEGDWNEWSRTVASQMLSKQSLPLVERQLDLTIAEKRDQFDTIMRLDNPLVKKKMLAEFADECDSSAVDLKATAFPRQAAKVILPVNSLGEKEIYAPTYRNGEEVVLIRYPHAGRFEIPRLKVNNKEPNAREILGNSEDAVGINAKVASQLSGADFDGDTVMVIPVNSRVKIQTKDPFKELQSFDPHSQYKGYDGMNHLSKARTQNEMGKVSNLITDMTIKGAPPDEIVRAVKHSMVIIDADKHNLDWKQSEKDNGIAELKATYQGGANRGASTLISKAKSVSYVDERQKWKIEDSRMVDKETGEKIFIETGKNKMKLETDPATGKKYKVDTGKKLQEKSTKMAEAKDAGELISDYNSPIERAYANYANKVRALGNEARKAYLTVPPAKYDPKAASLYRMEVESLTSKLAVALKNSPRERQAQLVTNAVMFAKKRDNPKLKEDKKELKKVTARVLAQTRARLGGHKDAVKITPKEWEAIQAGAIHSTTLKKILDNCDPDVLVKLATPRTPVSMSPARISRINAMKNSGYTIAEIADFIGVSTSTVSKALKGGD